MLKQLISAVLGAVTMMTSLPDSIPVQSGFYHTVGRNIISPDGKKTTLYGMGFGNDVWCSSLSEVGLHHNEDSFREMKDLGFNSVRFLLNYRWFEDDDKPYTYKQEGFDYIDQSIAWAKKYGIGLVLNMHYPQGGYQSQGKGTALWTDPENQKRLVSLWGEIARHYADEPAIIGYGIVNEPIVPRAGNISVSVAQCQSLVQRCTDAIRKTDGNHMIFAERVCAWQDASTGDTSWTDFDANDMWYLIDDPNVVYEAHYYEPFVFTHQSAGDDVSYPDGPYISTMLSYWVDCISAESRGSGDNYVESDYFERTDEYNMFAPVVHTWQLGSGVAQFDDLTVTEYSPDGSSRIIYYNGFSQSDETGSAWSSDGSGSCTASGGLFTVTGANSDYAVTFRRFELKEGCRYKVSGHVDASLANGARAEIRADFMLADKVYSSGSDYVSDNLSQLMEFSRKNNVPVFLGEFGADVECFKSDRGGERWVGDVLDYCISNGLSCSYHSYHESMFGLYPENTTNYPSHRNELLAQVFKSRLAENGTELENK